MRISVNKKCFKISFVEWWSYTIKEKAYNDLLVDASVTDLRNS